MTGGRVRVYFYPRRYCLRFKEPVPVYWEETKGQRERERERDCYPQLCGQQMVQFQFYALLSSSERINSNFCVSGDQFFAFIIITQGPILQSEMQHKFAPCFSIQSDWLLKICNQSAESSQRKFTREIFCVGFMRTSVKYSYSYISS